MEEKSVLRRGEIQYHKLAESSEVNPKECFVFSNPERKGNQKRQNQLIKKSVQFWAEDPFLKFGEW